ncbi:MAG: sulfite exporter TauE/SafE family protein [Parvibaculaceae bacterium]
MLGALFIGIAIGIRHALDADHLVAVATFLRPDSDTKRYAKLGIFWGLGHTFTILAICSVVALTTLEISPDLEAILEGIVGIMLIALGIHSWRILKSQGVHFHVHSHADGTTHFHAHRHDESAKEYHQHSAVTHKHEHERSPLIKALMVGAVHGVAGSAAISVMSLASASSVIEGLLFVLVFGLGTIIGMFALSYVLAWPIQKQQTKPSSWVPKFLRGLNAASIAIGAIIIINTGAHFTAPILWS